MAKYETLFKIVEDTETGVFYLEFEVEYRDAVEVKKNTYSLQVSEDLAGNLIFFLECQGIAMVETEEEEGDLRDAMNSIGKYQERLKKFLKK